MQKPLGILYLIPNILGGTHEISIVPEVENTVKNLQHFVVESFKEGRAMIKRCGLNPDEALSIELLNEHSDVKEIFYLIKPLLQGQNIGLISDAGCPAVADPGSSLVKLAHEKNIKVIPFVGPNAMIMALMASGFNGQQFSFNGYLPKMPKERAQQLNKMLQLAKSGFSQIFMETPYRNVKLLEEIINILPANTLLHIACNLTLPDSISVTKTLADWKKNLPDIHKKPCVFVLGN